MTDPKPPQFYDFRDVKSQSQKNLSGAGASEQQPILRTLENVLRTLSHTIGNPLAGLSLTLELLASTALRPNQERYVERCLRVAERLGSYKDLWGRLGNPHAQGVFPVTDLAAAVEEVLQSLHLTNTFTIEVDVPADAQQVLAHEGLLQLALTHLLRNAVEALGKGGTLGVCSRRKGASVRLSVWDDGPGLSAEAQEALWVKPIGDKAHGSGMGLFWVAAIVETVHGGNLCFSEKLPHGAAFHMDLAAPTQRQEASYDSHR